MRQRESRKPPSAFPPTDRKVTFVGGWHHPQPPVRDRRELPRRSGKPRGGAAAVAARALVKGAQRSA